jgi:UDP-2,4-diacetamido-2,4,6-trideoxy-beta-L-altropyranose hydrolase
MMAGALILIRVDASRQIGTGHVMRCLTLATAMREAGVTVEFICREHDGHLCDLLVQRGFAVRRLPAIGQALASDSGSGAFGGLGGLGSFDGFGADAGFSPALDRTPDTGSSASATATAGSALAHAHWLGCDWTQDAAQSVALLAAMPQRPAWLIVDHYALDFRWQRVLRAHVGQIMVIDDLADRQHDCDLLLDQNWVAQMTSRYARRVSASCTCLLGPQYALLQAAYADLRAQRKERQDPPRRIFAFFGGFDPANLSGMALDVFLAACQTVPAAEAAELQLDLVLPAHHPQAFEIEKLAHQHANVHLYSQLPGLAPLLAVADLALGAGGATSWERLCLGVPSLIVTVAANQQPGAAEQQAHGVLHVLGHLDHASAGVGAFSSAGTFAAARAALQARMQAALQQVLAQGVAALVPANLADVVDGLGVGRVLEKLLQQMPQDLQAHLSQQEQQAQQAHGTDLEQE